MWRKWDLAPRAFLPGENTSGYTDKAPPHKGVMWDETADGWIPKPPEPAPEPEPPTVEQKIALLQDQLAGLDAKSIRPLRALSREADPDELQRLAELEQQAEELRARIRELEGGAAPEQEEPQTEELPEPDVTE
jgi:hypothetical protein